MHSMKYYMQTKYSEFSKKELIKHFQEMFGKAPFPYFSRSFLIKYIIYNKQVDKYGDLPLSIQKQINKLIQKYQKNKSIINKDIKSTKTYCVDIGTKLIREFKGKKYEVTVLEKGFEYNGKIYKSLSAIANKITGTRWNGKVFFGVKNG